MNALLQTLATASSPGDFPDAIKALSARISALCSRGPGPEDFRLPVAPEHVDFMRRIIVALPTSSPATGAAIRQLLTDHDNIYRCLVQI